MEDDSREHTPEGSRRESTADSMPQSIVDSMPLLPMGKQDTEPELKKRVTQHELIQRQIDAQAAEGYDPLKELRDLKPKNRVKSGNPDNYFRRIAKVQGTVICAKNLPNLDTWSKSDPFCIVKGIRANNHLVDIYATRAIMNSLTPLWNENFHFTCPADWGLVDLVGLKLLVFDADDRYVSFMGSDDFLGGCDIDLTELKHARSIEVEADLDGGPKRKGMVFRKRKPRITVKVTIYHDWLERPEEFNDRLLNSMEKYTWVSQLECHIIKAKGLKNMDVRGKSDPMCIVSAVFLGGSVREIYRTQVVMDSLDPFWHERFSWKFNFGEEPMLLIFDVWDDDGGKGDITETGDHLGSAWVSVFEFQEVKKCKLELLGESQLLGSLLNKDGVSAAAARVLNDPSGGGMWAKKALSQQAPSDNAITSVFSRLRGLKSLIGQKARSTLVVECSVETQSCEMPHAVFMRKPREIREAKDALPIMPSFERSQFPIPHEIRKFINGERAQPGVLTGKDRVVWVSGAVHGASALNSADYLGKSDPFCVVEGVSNHGNRLFIHRTRVIRDSLCPSWHESFFMALPDNISITKLVFSVYDSDEGEVKIEKGGEDDFLGNCTVDLAYVMNGQHLYEDIPLVGFARSKKGPTPASGFKRSPVISVEVRAERRVQPSFEKYVAKAFTWSPRERHTISRKPGALGYADLSQKDLEPQPQAPRQVLHLHMTNQLASFAKQHKYRFNQWVETPVGWNSSGRSPLNPVERRPATAPEAVDIFKEPEQQPDESEEMRAGHCDFATLKHDWRLQRPQSVPELHTSFSRNRGARRQFVAGNDWLQDTNFRGDFESVAGLLTHGMRKKPPVKALTQIKDSELARPGTDHLTFAPQAWPWAGT